MNIKNIIYIILTIILGLILSFIIHAVIEICYLNYLLERGILPQPSLLTHQCYLPSFLQIVLLVAGFLGGYFLGNFWWRKVYIERKRGCSLAK